MGRCQKSVIYENSLLSFVQVNGKHLCVRSPQSNIIKSERQSTAGKKEGHQSPTEKDR